MISVVFVDYTGGRINRSRRRAASVDFFEGFSRMKASEMDRLTRIAIDAGKTMEAMLAGLNPTINSVK